MEFSRQKHWSGLPFPSPGDLPNPGIELRSPALWADALLSESLQSCPTSCDPMDCSLPGSSAYGIFQARIPERVGHFLLQGIFPTQGSNPRLLYWQVDSLPLSYLVKKGVNCQASTKIMLRSWPIFPLTHSVSHSTGVLLSTYNMPGCIPGGRNRVMNKTGKIPLSWS